MPAMILRSVVLPEPFGPMMATRPLFGNIGEADGKRGVMHSASGPLGGKNILGE